MKPVFLKLLSATTITLHYQNGKTIKIKLHFTIHLLLADYLSFSPQFRQQKYADSHVYIMLNLSIILVLSLVYNISSIIISIPSFIETD